jgi:hypothetical protein
MFIIRLKTRFRLLLSQSVTENFSQILSKAVEAVWSVRGARMSSLLVNLILYWAALIVDGVRVFLSGATSLYHHLYEIIEKRPLQARASTKSPIIIWIQEMAG